MKYNVVIAGLIRDCLQKYPEGCNRNCVYEYCIANGAQFENANEWEQKKSVSGQLSKMKSRGIVEMPVYGIWMLKR